MKLRWPGAFDSTPWLWSSLSGRSLGSRLHSPNLCISHVAGSSGMRVLKLFFVPCIIFLCFFLKKKQLCPDELFLIFSDHS